MDTLKEIVESIDIIAEKKFEKTTQIYYGVVISVSDNKCSIIINNKTFTLPIYGGIVFINKTYAVVLPQNNINQAFVIGESSGGVAISYNSLLNKPSINNVELAGNKSTSELGITKSAVGLGNVDNVRQYSVDNPPPIPSPSQVGAIPSPLTSDFYGDTLPASGTVGRIFFLKV